MDEANTFSVGFGPLHSTSPQHSSANPHSAEIGGTELYFLSKHIPNVDSRCWNPPERFKVSPNYFAKPVGQGFFPQFPNQHQRQGEKEGNDAQQVQLPGLQQGREVRHGRHQEG